ncbi:MAG: hypothetical protein HLUCCA08_08055 [Rhodobacteraceae bacterium HLUCCA08]|nr:MAG: hypothetical protein HLUCCA08_08055 [Rhodobacteraceae bacterium HLUCCA08]
MTAEIHTVDEVILRLADELRRAGGDLKALEGATVTALREAGQPFSSDLLGALQNFDMLLQTMDAVAGFLDDIAAALPDGIEIEIGHAFRRIPLLDLMHRLRPGGAPPGTAGPIAGSDPVLF